MAAPPAAHEIEIVLAQVPWIDRWGEACALPSDLTVTVFARSRRRDGTLASRTMLDLRGEASISAADRALIDLLLGCTPTFLGSDGSHAPSYAPSPRDAVARAYLTGAKIHPSAAARVLPALCASGRLVWFASAPEPESPASHAAEVPRPLRWDGDAPFTARLRAQSDGRGIALQLELARDAEVVAADRGIRFASAGYLFAEDRVIRVDGCDDLGRWFVAAGLSPLRVPARELAALIETIGNSPRAPQLMLDALGWTTVPGTPGPRLYLEPIPGTARLGGRVAFHYGELEVAAGGRSWSIGSPDR